MILQKFLRKTVSLVTALTITSLNLTGVSAITSASNMDEQPSATPISQEYLDYINNGEKGMLIPSPIDMSLMSQPINSSNYILHATSLPSSFDLRTKGLDNYIRSQGQLGTCWAIAATEGIESTMLYNNPLIDLSEWHLAYFSYTGTPAFDTTSPSLSTFNQGGNSYIAIASLSNWIGAIDEKQAPYNSSTSLDLSTRYDSQYHLQDANFLSTISQMKQAIYDGSAVSIGYFADTSYYSPATYSQYCDNMSNVDMATGHAVTVVGWDDNYSKDNFNSGCQPTSNGAWLVKNSWGLGWGDDGYFWLSYYDDTLHLPIKYNVESADNYSENYHYDDFGWLLSLGTGSRTSSYMANIFTADSDCDISAAGFYTTDNNVSYQITIYTDLTSAKVPNSGTAHTTQNGAETYAGYHTVELNEPVTVKKGEKYSVVMKLTNPTTSIKPIPVEASVTGLLSTSTITDNTQSGQSFISSTGANWTDLNGYYYSTSTGSLTTSSSSDIAIGNVCLKAFARPTLKVTFSDESTSIPYGTEITLSSNGSDAIYYTTDGSIPNEKSKLYTGAITIDKDMTISAIAVKDGDLGNVETHSYTQATCGLSSLIIKNEGETAKKLDTTSSMSFSTTQSNVLISPISTANITINGNEVTSGEYYSVPLIYGNNTITITLSDEGKLSKTYTVTINTTANKPAELDYNVYLNYLDETISFDSKAVKVTDIDGNNVISDISQYIGQSLTVTPTNNTAPYTIDIPSKPQISIDDTIDFQNETLANIIDDKLIFSYNSNMSDYLNVTDNLDENNLLSIKPNTTIYFQLPATDTSFASDIISIQIPKAPTITEDMLVAQNITDNSLSFKEIEGALYRIKLNSNFSNWQTTPQFKNLLPDTVYNVSMYLPATQSSFASNTISINVSTLASIIKGDVYQDNKIDVFDLILTKQYLISNISLSESQTRCADMNNDSSITISDMIELIEYIINH